ncbi:MAG: transcriptional repressor LexA [bacterium]|nr:transcriptional repressor LexA [bacterium]
MGLTPRQKEILDFIAAYRGENGYSPSVREIAAHFHLSSPATVHEHIQRLMSGGYLTSDGTPTRALVPAERDAVDTGIGVLLPLVGLITAGEPIEAIEEREMIAVPANFVVDGSNSFVLRVKGRSMIEEGIYDGDYVVIERNPSPRDGDVVVALLDNNYATLKKFYREPGRIRLQPANSTMKPIFVRDVTIQGIVRAVIRQFSHSAALS